MVLRAVLAPLPGPTVAQAARQLMHWWPHVPFHQRVRVRLHAVVEVTRWGLQVPLALVGATCVGALPPAVLCVALGLPFSTTGALPFALLVCGMAAGWAWLLSDAVRVGRWRRAQLLFRVEAALAQRPSHTHAQAGRVSGAAISSGTLGAVSHAPTTGQWWAGARPRSSVAACASLGTIVAVLLAVAGPQYRATTCAQQSAAARHALLDMQLAQTAYRARYGMYASVDQLDLSGLLPPSVARARSHFMQVERTAEGYVITARERTADGTTDPHADLWQVGPSGAPVHVTRGCR